MPKFSSILRFSFYSSALVLTTGFIASTAYLIHRDITMGEQEQKFASVKASYLERIERLEADLEHARMRKDLLDNALEDKIDTLLIQHKTLESRHAQLSALISAMRNAGIQVMTSVPSAKPTSLSPLQNQKAAAQIDPIVTGSLATPTQDADEPTAKLSHNVDPLQVHKAQTETILEDQSTLLEYLVGQLSSEKERLNSKLRRLNRTTKTRQPAHPNIGGPFIPVEPAQADLTDYLHYSSTLLQQVTRMRQIVGSYPVRRPVKARYKVSSRFGTRKDPFLRKRAMHSGMDFAAPEGTPVYATAAGFVTMAKRNGGYGKMIEITHGKGLTTRYAHLNTIKVKPGAWVKSGHIIGSVGSTGRSTGPHLHYETRHLGKPLNPHRFLREG